MRNHFFSNGNWKLVFVAGFVATLLSPISSWSLDSTAQQPARAPGWSTLGFEVPQPGTYPLPPSKTLGTGTVLLENGTQSDLRSLYKDKVVVLSFIYTRCGDVNGCPLSSFVLRNFAAKLRDNPEISAKTRLISLSFDPANDVPKTMKDYGFMHRPDKSSDWLFLTAANEKTLQPILDDFGISVEKEYNENGDEVGSFAHLMRVYLIDPKGRIRSIYSPDFLHQDLLQADVETILYEL